MLYNGLCTYNRGVGGAYFRKHLSRYTPQHAMNFDKFLSNFFFYFINTELT